MFALRVTYLMGRVYSSVFEDGDNKADPEWPPHPSRLFSALTAAWGEGGAEEELRPALEWLEAQEPPSILFGGHTPRRLVQAFVPVNDSVTMPEDRSRKGRGFPSATLNDPNVYFVWNVAPPAEVQAKLDRILARTSSLGHSSSLVSVEVAAMVKPEGLTEWHAGASQGERLRIPYAGRLGDLEESHKRFVATAAKIHRPGPGKTTLYAAVTEEPSSLTRGVFDRMIILKPEDQKRSPRSSLRSALSVTTALRGALLDHSPQPVPEYISGHAPDSTPEAPRRSEFPHVAFIPLANVGYKHSGGELMGAAVVLPASLTREQQEICWLAVESIQKLRMPWGSWDVRIADAEEGRSALLPGTWTAASKVWSTVTPFVFDRYPKDPYGAEAEERVRQAFARIGLPEPQEIDLHYNPWLSGVPKASAFPPAAARTGKPQRYHCHVWARFDRPVAGPVIAGAGRFYGYGLFRQIWKKEGEQR